MVKVDFRFSGEEVNDPNIIVDKNGNILLFGGGFAHGFSSYLNIMVLKPHQGTAPYSGDRYSNPKVFLGSSANSPYNLTVM